MLENMRIVGIRNIYGELKWPKLIECANYYKIQLDENRLHQSMYDVEIMARVFYVMLKKNSTKEKILSFIINGGGMY